MVDHAVRIDPWRRVHLSGVTYAETEIRCFALNTAGESSTLESGETVYVVTQLETQVAGETFRHPVDGLPETNALIQQRLNERKQAVLARAVAGESDLSEIG
jgi:hypothetical protein